MDKQKATAVFDVGKTNKKLFLFNGQYKIIHEESQRFDEIKDEDGFPCENIHTLTAWVKNKLSDLLSNNDHDINAVNFSAYGASLVHLDNTFKIVTPLYNYLKPYPEKLKEQFYTTYGGESSIAKQTASPVLGSLNSGMQLYRLKYEQPEVFARIKYSLHLPQYLSSLITKQMAADITSVGCHTHLWNFQQNNYHHWVHAEALTNKLPAVSNGDKVFDTLVHEKNIVAGIGLHDSSAALIPYLKLFSEPFVLISTGTWCISLNPFNAEMLTEYELQNDCLCYLDYQGKPVKASRLFAGNEHEQQVKRLAQHFNVKEDYYKTVVFNNSLQTKLKRANTLTNNIAPGTVQQSLFEQSDLHDFKTYEEAYHQLIFDIIMQQHYSTKLVLGNTPVKKILVDGGFGNNDVYMHLLAAVFYNMHVYSASIPQATSFGAALALQEHLHIKEIPHNIIELKKYTADKFVFEI